MPEDVQDTGIEEFKSALHPDLMFMAFCYSCHDVSTFQYGRCLECKTIWKPLTQYTEKYKTTPL